MAKKASSAKRKSPFDCGSGSDDDADDDGFKEYVKKRAHLAKETINKSSVNYEIEQDLKEEDKETPSRSKFMKGFIKAKKLRELDRLRNESLKIEVERQLDDGNVKTNDESFVTESYKDRKRAMKEVIEGDKKELEGETADVSVACYDFRTSFLERDFKVKESTKLDEQQQLLLLNRASQRIENDIYIAEDFKEVAKTRHKDDDNDDSTTYADVTVTTEAVERFLRSTKTEEEIDGLKKGYWERVKFNHEV
ncbi:HEL065Wp [Eremothecium sinecaudum]|uniref:HEL065Wp n=1 Tax=Eremothecium sinecaudum TaxID=45286 RepID=A0A0X8HTM6_9SACH|nr:HEL065Wp [Eremothecium sinecaudum]AMD21215.1 HEL065Wp [Eremothecium sinecaudum]